MAKEKSQTMEFVVRVKLPERVRAKEVRNYIAEAVEWWGQQTHEPDEPLGCIEQKQVKVTRPHAKKQYLCSFTGHTVEGHALIKSATPQKAAKLLEEELKRIGLPQEVDAEDMEQVDGKSKIIIVDNGEY